MYPCTHHAFVKEDQAQLTNEQVAFYNLQKLESQAELIFLQFKFSGSEGDSFIYGRGNGIRKGKQHVEGESWNF